MQELYHELHALDRFEQDFQRKFHEEESVPAARRGKTRPVIFTWLILILTRKFAITDIYCIQFCYLQRVL